jgi:RimJ/RimL family protein N-acetyltransferase
LTPSKPRRSIRPSTAGDLDRILPLIQPDAAVRLGPDGYCRNLAEGQYRPEFTWLATDELDPDPRRVLAVAVWWAPPHETAPASLDAFYVHESIIDPEERIALAAELLRRGQSHFADEYSLAEPPGLHAFVPGDWRDRPEVMADLAWRQEAVQQAGLTALLERLRYEWTPQDGLPAASERLTFRAEPDDEVFVELFGRVLAGSLDTSTTSAAAKIGAQAQARADVALYRDSLIGERSWWRVAENAAGEPVGFALPSKNNSFPVVGYLGVLPEHRGHGYADDLLAEITRILVAEVDAQKIRADTDLVNTPMAASFERVGYRNFMRRLVYSAPRE